MFKIGDKVRLRKLAKGQEHAQGSFKPEHQLAMKNNQVLTIGDIRSTTNVYLTELQVNGSWSVHIDDLVPYKKPIILIRG